MYDRCRRFNIDDSDINNRADLSLAFLSLYRNVTVGDEKPTQDIPYEVIEASIIYVAKGIEGLRQEIAAAGPALQCVSPLKGRVSQTLNH